MKRLIVELLEVVCPLFHWLPPHKCRCAGWSLVLNDRWGLDVWTEG